MGDARPDSTLPEICGKEFTHHLVNGTTYCSRPPHTGDYHRNPVGYATTRQPGDRLMYATCTRGHRHWGADGAAGALVVASSDVQSPRLLLTLRSRHVHWGGTWSIPGGAIDVGETPRQAAYREVVEELRITVAALPVIGVDVADCGGWQYTTIVAHAPEPVVLHAYGWETDDVRWFSPNEVDDLHAKRVLHPGFAAAWPRLRPLTTDDPTIVRHT